MACSPSVAKISVCEGSKWQKEEQAVKVGLIGKMQWVQQRNYAKLDIKQGHQKVKCVDIIGLNMNPRRYFCK